MYYFIINPAAGTGMAAAAVPVIERRASARGIDCTIIQTTKPDDFERIAGMIDYNAVEAIACVGGDGTLCEYAGLVAGCGIKYGVVPVGSANDLLFALPAGVKGEPRRRFRSFEEKVTFYTEKIFDGATMAIDAITINHEKYFLNIGGTGIEIQVLKDALPLKKYIKGGAYFISLMKNAVTYQAGEMMLTVDGVAERDVYLSLAICNGSHYGGGMRIAPPAVIDDGKITLCKIRKMPRLKLAALFPAVKPGWHASFKEVSYINCESVELVYEGRKIINLDGNLVEYASPLTFDIVKAAVRFII